MFGRHCFVFLTILGCVVISSTPSNYQKLQSQINQYDQILQSLLDGFLEQSDGCEFLANYYYGIDTTVTCAEKGIGQKKSRDFLWFINLDGACNIHSRQDLQMACQTDQLFAKTMKNNVKCERKRIKNLKRKTDAFTDLEATNFLKTIRECWPGLEGCSGDTCV